MKQFHIVLSVMLCASCASTHPTSRITYNGATTTDAKGQLLLLGQHPRTNLQLPPFADWFNKNYADYMPDTSTIAALKPGVQEKQFDIFLGTWCVDSRREVPRMLKILDACGVPTTQIHLIFVDYRNPMYKKSPGHEEYNKYIHHVPTILVYNNNRETGRIIESPRNTLEKDLLQITTGTGYIPNYPGAAFLAARFDQQPLPDLQSQFQQLVDTLKTYLTSPSELNTFSRILLDNAAPARALLTLQLNATLFPGNPQLYNQLGATYRAMGDSTAARQHFSKALTLDPNNEIAKAALAER